MTDEERPSRLGREIDRYDERMNTAKSLRTFHKCRDDHANKRGYGDSRWLVSGFTLDKRNGSHGEYTIKFDGGYVLHDEAVSALATALSKYLTQAALEAAEALEASAKSLRSEVIQDALRIVSEMEAKR